MRCLIVVNISHAVHNCMRFLNMLRWFCAFVHARVFVNAFESVRNCLRGCGYPVCIIIRFFEGMMLVKTNPPSVKAGYGPVY